MYSVFHLKIYLLNKIEIFNILKHLLLYQYIYNKHSINMAKGKAPARSVTCVSKNMGARPANFPGPKIIGIPAGKSPALPDGPTKAQKQARLEQEKMAIEAVRLAKANAQKEQDKIELLRTVAMLLRQSQR